MLSCQADLEAAINVVNTVQNMIFAIFFSIEVGVIKWYELIYIFYTWTLPLESGNPYQAQQNLTRYKCIFD